MFVPLYDGKPMSQLKWPIVNYCLIAANILVYFLVQTPIGINQAAMSLGLIPAVVNDLAVLPQGTDWIEEDLTFLTYAFLHGDFFHLGGNMLFLWVFGDNVEDAMGHIKYLIFYCICAIAAGFGHSLLFVDAEAPLIGASGAVAAIIAAYLMLYPNMRVWVLLFGKIPLPISAMWCLGAWIALQVFSVVFDSDSQVSWISHVGGIVAGAILIPFFKYSHIPLFERKSPS